MHCMPARATMRFTIICEGIESSAYRMWRPCKIWRCCGCTPRAGGAVPAAAAALGGLDSLLVPLIVLILGILTATVAADELRDATDTGAVAATDTRGFDSMLVDSGGRMWPSCRGAS